jgi:penicillin-insensitive murein endopeptidase
MSSLSRFSVGLTVAAWILAAPSVGAAKEPSTKTASARSHEEHGRSKGKKHDDGKVERDATKSEADDDKKQGRGSKKSPRARSIGAPNRGELEGAVRLQKAPHLAVRDGAHTWGLPDLVRLLRSTADEVAGKHKGAVLFVGDLSAKGGGPLSGHNSHQSGRDADVGFFLVNSKGKSVNPKRFMAFSADGHSRDADWARFDDGRNWTLVEALLKDERVRYVFVSNALKARLLKFASKKHVSEALMTRAASIMMAPDHVDVHDDHFHVRLSCPASSKDCVEESTGQAQSVAADVYADAPSPAAAPSSGGN